MCKNSISAIFTFRPDDHLMLKQNKETQDCKNSLAPSAGPPVTVTVRAVWKFVLSRPPPPTPGFSGKNVCFQLV